MMRAYSVLAIGFIAIAASMAQAQLPFFPGAEGFGGTWSGSAPAGGWLSNASVYRVTNLNDSGAGSLRGAFVENSTNKIVIFDVAGVINIGNVLDIKNLSNYYIAGQTAPGPVTITGNMGRLTHSPGKENRNVVLRYLSFRKGTTGDDDAITFAGGGLGTNLMIDHVSASWSTDENISVANNNTNITVQYSSIHDALENDHAYGSLLRPRIDSNVTFHHNLYANNASRQARFGTYLNETLTADFRNNVVYNFRDRASYAGGSTEDASTQQEYADVNYVGNYVIAGPGTGTVPAEYGGEYIFRVDKNITTQVYQSGNYADMDEAPGNAPSDSALDGSDQGTSMFVVSEVIDQSLTFMGTPFTTPSVTTQAAPAAYEQIVDYVGNFWWARDAIDTRVISNVTDFTGVPIGAAAPIASELSALLATPMTTHAAGYDLDNDGMQDTWETLHGGNLNPMLDFDSDGYINLMEFINEKGEFPAPAPIVFNGSANTRYANIMNWKTNDGGITAGSNWQPSKYDVAVINNGNVVVDAVGQHAGVLQIAPSAGNTATLSVNSGWLKAATEIQVGSATGDGTLTIAAAGTVFAPVVTIGTQGELNGAGDIVGNVLNNGLVSPGSSPGTLDVSGNFAQNAGGVLKMEIASTSSFDQLNIGGALMAGGTLDIDLLSFSPAAGNSFDLFDFASSLSGFTLDLPSLSGGLEWFTDNLLTTGELSVVSASVAEDADFDGDGDVDGRDFLIWQRGFGLTGQENNSLGDANGDGDVDPLDLAVWQAQYGQPTELAASQAAVPEPTCIGLLATFCLATCFRRSRAA
jgi:hypothetical protein